MGLGVWTFLSLLYIAGYILSFQTMLSVATSYQSRREPAVMDVTNEYAFMDISHIQVPSLVLHDGSRVGQADMESLCYSGEEPDNLCPLFYDCES